MLHIFAELLLRREYEHKRLPDVILIDEIETHLHLELQETILPFLTSMFPECQFVVATHSPAVIASIPDAIVYDLETRKQANSSDFQGLRYGTLMTAHFGLSEEFDIDTTKELQRLKALRKSPDRSAAETEEMLKIAGRLSGKSHMLALEVMLEMEAQKVAQ